ncbi:g4994 [Coccomyxa elongata]
MGLIFSLLVPRQSARSDQRECEAGKHSGSEGLKRNIVQDVSSDSDSDFDSQYDSELETDAEDWTKLGDDIWVQEEYLAYLKEFKDMDIILFC